jgi:hypothetical protein
LVIEHFREYGATGRGGKPRNCTDASHRSTKRRISRAGGQR